MTGGIRKVVDIATAAAVAAAGAAVVVACNIAHPAGAAARPVVHTEVVVDHLIPQSELDGQAAEAAPAAR